VLFNSYVFIFLFLPLTLLAFYGLARARLGVAAVYALIIASLVFYAGWNYRYLPLLGFSIAFNYLVGRSLAQTPKRPLLVFGITVNLLLLGYFKYADFALATLGAALGRPLAPLLVILPLGISFITFQKIAFLVDSYRGFTKGYRLRDFLLFVTFFPQLIAGPIVHHQQLIPQLKGPRILVWQPQNLAIGAFYFSVGLFKKVIIADTLARWVAPTFNALQPISCFEAWAGVFGYAFQIFFDFSGYSEMAIGLALLCNLNLPVNFLSPYQATSVADFWRRWHITLSTWFNDYVFTPLAFATKAHGKVALVGSTLVTFTLCGLWHGAGWTFIIYGVLHGVGVAAHIVTKKGRRKLAERLPRRLFVGGAMGLTFLYVCFAFVFFRAGDFTTVQHVLWALAGQGDAGRHGPIAAAVGLGRRDQACVLVALYAWVVFAPNTVSWAKHLRPTWPWALWIAVLFITAVLHLDRPTAFIYYQF
jgi:alginate O-acetyltransferase complex protein AlgI